MRMDWIMRYCAQFVLVGVFVVALSAAPRAWAHGYELHGSAPYRFGISMYVARPMRVGVTQPIFECWAHRLLFDKAEIIVFSRDELEPADDAAWQATVAKLQAVDLFIVTENPKQEFAEALLEKADMMYQRPLIYADLGLPPLMSEFEDPYPERTPPLPYFSMNTAGQLMYAMANACMRMDPSNNLEIRRNWQDYTTLLEILKRRTLENRAGWREIDARVVTLRGGPEYLIEETGMEIAGVVPPLPEGPVGMEQVPALVEALRKLHAQVLVTTEPLDPAVRAAVEREGAVLVCELEPVGLACEDIYAWERSIGKSYKLLLEAKESVWMWEHLGGVAP
jgi:ABC-type Zn uptake system ZnuABC Zn-binding protein ZnuA